MDEGDGDRALADRRSNPLDAAAADISDREDSGQTGLEKLWRPSQRPPGRNQIVRSKIGAGLDETFLVKSHAASEPFSTRDRTRHRKQMPYLMSFSTATNNVPPTHPLETGIPVEGDDFGLRPELDSGIVLDPANQVSRHCVGQAPRPHQHMNAAGALGQKDSSLPGRIPSAHDNDLFAAA